MHKSTYKEWYPSWQEYIQTLRHRHTWVHTNTKTCTTVHTNTKAQMHNSTYKEWYPSWQEYIQTLRHRHRHTRVHTNTETQMHKGTYKHQGTDAEDYRVKLVWNHWKACNNWCTKTLVSREKTFSSSPCFKKHSCLGVAVKDGVYYCYCAYVLRISRYSDFLSLMLTNTGIFLRGLKLSGESRS